MKKFPSKIFLDGGLPEETKKANEILLEKFGRPLDGQTTNPTLIAKNLKTNQESRIKNQEAVRHLRGGRMDSSQVEESVKPKGTPGVTRRDSPGVEEPAKRFRLTPQLALAEYKRIVQEMSKIIPKGSISIQVFANQETKSEEMLKQARERHKWIPNSSIKLPCTAEGLKTAEIVCREFPINITLAFSQSQAAAVYEATKGAKYPVFISPFVGRLDDRGERGMDVVANILRMYREHAESHERRDAPYGASRSRRVEVLTASVRNLGHIFRAFTLSSNIITIPFKVFKEWSLQQFRSGITSDPVSLGIDDPVKKCLSEISYQENITLGKPWQDYDLHHDLTTRGIDLFWNDWMGLFK